MNTTEYGARVERGTIESASDGRCVVSSFDRYGIRVDCALPSGCAVGDRVLFVLFDDGESRIILKM